MPSAPTSEGWWPIRVMAYVERATSTSGRSKQRPYDPGVADRLSVVLGRRDPPPPKPAMGPCHGGYCPAQRRVVIGYPAPAGAASSDLTAGVMGQGVGQGTAPSVLLD